MRTLPLAANRVFSTSAAVAEPIRNLRKYKFIALLHRETRNPLWSLLDALRQPKHRLALSQALFENGVSSSEYERWKFLTHEPSIDSALEKTPKEALPSWAVLYLMQTKVRSSQQAHGPLLDLLHTHLDIAPRDLHAPLILLTAVQLARFNLVVPLRQVASTFLHTWISHNPDIYFNLFLQTISCIPNRTVESASIAVMLLKSMESRQLPLTSDTYTSLLSDRFVTLQLTKYLQERMVQEHFIPESQHLEAYLRFFAKDGAIHDASKYHKLIQTQIPPIPKSQSHLKPSTDPHIKANTLMLSANSSVNSAFHFLRKLTRTSISSPENIPSTLPAKIPTHIHLERRKPIQRYLNTKFLNIYDFTTALSVAIRDNRMSSNHLLKMFNKRAPGLRWTTVTFTVLLRGLLLKGDIGNAVSYWRKLVRSGLVLDEEAVATGVVVLTRAGKIWEAVRVLEEWCWRGGFGFFGIEASEGEGLDLEVGLGMGMGMEMNVSGGWSGIGKGKGKEDQEQQPKMKLTQKTINDFMVALIRIQRPDIVFRIWDNMEILYGVLPNSTSLSILLQSARLAHKMDDGDGLKGAIAQLGLKNPFSRSSSSSTSSLPSSSSSSWSSSSSQSSTPSSTSSPSKPRKTALEEITSLIYDTNKSKPVSYTSGIWKNNQKSTETVRKIFLQTLFGMALSQNKVEEMLKAEAPVGAIRVAYDSDPNTYSIGALSGDNDGRGGGSGFGMKLGLGLGLGLGWRELGLGWPSLKPVKWRFIPFEDLFDVYISTSMIPSSSSSTSSSTSSSSSSSSPTSTSTSTKTTKTILKSYYPSITITNQTIFQYLSLLCISSRAIEIPLLFNWMKILGLKASDSTLGIGLALWNEVGGYAPLIEKWHDVVDGGGINGNGNESDEDGVKEINNKVVGNGDGNGTSKKVQENGSVGGGGEIGKFRWWLENWVGRGRVPNRKEVEKWARVVDKLREVRR